MGTGRYVACHCLLIELLGCGGQISNADNTSGAGTGTTSPSTLSATGGFQPGTGGSSATGGTLMSAGGVLLAAGSTQVSGGNPATTLTSASGGSTAAAAPFIYACPGFAVPNQDAGECVGMNAELEPSPIDILIMIDRTLSMTYCMDGRPTPNCAATATDPSRWQVLQDGIQSLLTNPDFVKLQPRIGLGFFGATGNPDDPTECLASTYAVPDIEIEDLSTVSSKIFDRIAYIGTQNPDGTFPYLGGQTPWQPALWGALQHMQGWQNANPQRAAVVVLVTDGLPTECDTNLSDIMLTVGEYFSGVQGAYNTAGKPSIRSYLFGMGSDIAASPSVLSSVASVSGGGPATFITSVGDTDLFPNHLTTLAKSYRSGQFPLPPPPAGQTIDPNLVKVEYTPSGGSAQEILAVASAADCTSAFGGWYFDNPTAPTQIVLCPCSYASVGMGSLQVAFGCRPYHPLD